MLLRYVTLIPNCYSNTYSGTYLTCDAEDNMSVADDASLGTFLNSPVELSIEPTADHSNMCK